MKTAVVGASGYAGGELLRLLEVHPTFVPGHITAHANAGELINSIHPHLSGYDGNTFSQIINPDGTQAFLETDWQKLDQLTKLPNRIEIKIQNT